MTAIKISWRQSSLTCVCALVCFEVRALGVHLPAAIEVTPVHSPPPVRRRLTTGQPWPLRVPLHAPSPYFPRRLQRSLYPTPRMGYRPFLAQLRWGWRRADDGRAQVFSTVSQNVSQRTGGEVESRGELLRAVRSLTAGVGVEAAGIKVLVVLIVFLLLDVGNLWVCLIWLVPAGKHQLAPQVLLALKFDVRGWDIGLTLEVPLQLEACLCGGKTR